jgi:hypothetical protein
MAPPITPKTMSAGTAAIDHFTMNKIMEENGISKSTITALIIVESLVRLSGSVGCALMIADGITDGSARAPQRYHRC